MKNDSERRMAAALHYDRGQSAPRVTAKGQGLVAEEIIRRAREAGVALHESPILARMLLDVELDQAIPPQLYRVVAELLAWIYQIENRQPQDSSRRPPTTELT